MALLNPPNILPNGMHLIAKYLAAHGKPVDRQRLKAALQPSTLPLRRDGTNTFDACLKALQDLALITADGAAISAAPDLAVAADARAFGDTLLFAVCSSAGAAQDDIATPQRDLLVALTWWCAQDPYGAPIGWQEVGHLLSHDLGSGFASFPIGNSNPWQSFVRWATTLGFAEHDGLTPRTTSTLVPDFTRALRAVLRKHRPSGETTATRLVALLQDRLPMIDGGLHATALRSTWNLPVGRRAAANALDLAFSHALLRCEEDGVLKLENRSDAEKVLLSDGPDVRPVSHVVLHGVMS
jgi:hypothetical protein